MILASGCVTSLHEASTPTEVKFHLQIVRPQQLTVRVALEPPAEYPIPQNGRVAFTVPGFNHGCDVYFLGFIKTRDGSAEQVRVVEVRDAEGVLRRFSLSQIANLPKDEAGYSVVKIGD